MTTGDWVMMILASLMTLTGLGLLLLSWKRPGRPIVLLGGWALLAGALVIAFAANGDRGIAQATLLAMAGAVMIFAVPVARGIAPPVAAVRARQTTASPDGRRSPWFAGLAGLWTFLLAGPLAGVIALFASAGLFRLIRPAEGSPATAGAAAIIAAILIWAGLSVLLLIEPSRGRRTIYAVLALAASTAAAFI